MAGAGAGPYFSLQRPNRTTPHRLRRGHFSCLLYSCLPLRFPFLPSAALRLLRTRTVFLGTGTLPDGAERGAVGVAACQMTPRWPAAVGSSPPFGLDVVVDKNVITVELIRNNR